LHTRYKYSLLVPCYNAEKYVAKFIGQIRSLNKSFDEIIFYDDCSTDDTVPILLSAGYQVIRASENKGPGFARNRLAEVATCEFIHFHDIDDEFNPDFLQLVDNQLKIKKSEVTIGYADWIDANNRQPLLKWRYQENELLKAPLPYLISNPLGVINTVYLKEAFLNIHGFNEKIKCWEDADLHVRFAASTASFSVINEVLAYSIRHNEGISSDQSWCWTCRLKFIRIYLEKYIHLTGPEIFKTELKKIQTMFIINGQYQQLKQVINLNNKYQLGAVNNKIFLIYQFNRIMPAPLINMILRFIRKINKS
jgi:glycosyltransferase involved in cell wall biosynthesis